MSTRCQIGFYSTSDADHTTPDAMIYRHHDGDPESVLPVLIPWAKDFAAKRGLADAEYAAANALVTLVRHHSPDTLTGYGICGHQTLHGDINYYYRVDPSGIRVYKVKLDTSLATLPTKCRRCPI